MVPVDLGVFSGHEALLRAAPGVGSVTALSLYPFHQPAQMGIRRQPHFVGVRIEDQGSIWLCQGPHLYTLRYE